MNHSPIGASKMEIWANCPGSVILSKGIEVKENKYMKQGILAHEIAAKYLNHEIIDFDVSEEMLEAVQFYTDVIELEDKDIMWVEHKFDLSHLYPEVFGTADCVILNGTTLKVFDFKYGAGVAVDIEDNYQLMYYAVGALLSLQLKVEKIEIIIVQPRGTHPNGTIRIAELTPNQLTEFFSFLIERAELTKQPNAEIKLGSWCQFCAAKKICPLKI